MERVPEATELMDEDAQARAYAHADFAAPHGLFIERFAAAFGTGLQGRVLDLGCGPADITIRFARAHPGCILVGVDGAAAMLKYGRGAIAAAGLDDRIALVQEQLPGAHLPHELYDAVISNSLLHHLHNPMVLWQSVAAYAAPGAPVFIMDLMRPATPERARQLQLQYAAGEPEILRQDFYNSLCAAYTPEEVRGQLQAAGMAQLRVEVISDRHLTVAGRAQ